MIRPDDVALTGAIVWRFPELMEMFREHLTDNNREVIPHVSMGQIERWAEQLVHGQRPL